MVEIDVTCHLEAFRRFLVSSTCRSFIPESYLRDPEVFPEKEAEPGSIYIEAADKVTLKRIRDITFVNANEVLGIIYTSKSGHSRLKWRQQSGPIGRVTGDASSNSLVNLSMARVISPEYLEELVSKEGGGAAESDENVPPPQTPAALRESAPPQPVAPAAPAAPQMEPAPPQPQLPIEGEPVFPPDEEEDDLEAADADEEDQEELEEQEVEQQEIGEQEREETAA